MAVGADFGIQESIEILLELIAAAFAQGAPRIKLKCCKGWDTEVRPFALGWGWGWGLGLGLGLAEVLLRVGYRDAPLLP